MSRTSEVAPSDPASLEGRRTNRCSGRGWRKRWSLAADLGVIGASRRDRGAQVMPLRQLAVSRTSVGNWSFRVADGPVDAIAIIVADESGSELAWSASSDA